MKFVFLIQDNELRASGGMMENGESSSQEVSAYSPVESQGRSRLSDTQRMLIEQRISNDKPSTGAAYILWFFFWPFGGHRFYLGRSGSAIAMLILSITVVGLLVTSIWALVDLFLIPGIVRDRLEAMRQRLTLELIAWKFGVGTWQLTSPAAEGHRGSSNSVRTFGALAARTMRSRTEREKAAGGGSGGFLDGA